MNPDPPLLDIRCTVETPEGIEFDAVVAGPVPRILAYVIDFCWRALIYMLFLITSLLLDKVATGLFLIVAFLLEWFYPVFFEIFRNGQTPGKKRFNIRVVNDDFTPVSWSNSCIRNLLRAADFMPFFYLFGVVSIVLSGKFQRLGDLAAGTLVIYNKSPDDVSIPNDIQSATPSVPLNSSEKQSIADFLLRSESISEARQQELSDLVPHITNKQGSEGLAQLKSIAAWLLGKK